MLKALIYWTNLEKKIQMYAELDVFISSFHDTLISGFLSCWVVSATSVVLRSIIRVVQWLLLVSASCCSRKEGLHCSHQIGS